ncbi:MAG: ECF transporter S component [Deltaproteobacteria bacterium]|jgi:energy-coupling factor transport system substrate-specific component|nr:ECF transporter S component [Deltaproteobacteria bacterium]
MSNNLEWKLKDVIVMAIVSMVFAVVYLLAVYLGVFFSTLLSPLGLAPLANEPIYGIWFMASTFIAYVLRKPGAAFISEVLAALMEVLLGNMYGPLVLISGAIQGLGAELVFLITRYKNFSLSVMCLAGVSAGVFSFVWGYFRGGFTLIATWLLATMLLVRLVSSAFFAGYLSRRLALSFVKSGLLKSFGTRKLSLKKSDQDV